MALKPAPQTDAGFIIALQNYLPAGDWPWTLAALRQDGDLWAALNHSPFGAQALAALPAAGAAWTPAALAALTLPADAELRAALAPGSDVQALPPLPAAWSVRLAPVLRHYALAAPDEPGSEVARPHAPADDRPRSLYESVLHALALRERFRHKTAWATALTNAGLHLPGAGTALACLYGWLPQALPLLRALALPIQGLAHPALALQVLFCQPLPPAEQQARLHTLLAGLPPVYGLGLLKALHALQPALAQTLAHSFLPQAQALWAANAPAAAGHEPLAETLEHLAGQVRLAQTYQLAGQTDLAAPLFAEGLRVARRMRGHLAAGLAAVLSVTPAPAAADTPLDNWQAAARQTSQEAWKQALQRVPDAGAYAAGWVQALLANGQVQEAQAFLLRRNGANDDPALLLAAAQTALRLGDAPAAVQQARQALRQSQTAGLSAGEWRSMAQLFIEQGLAQEAAAAAQHGLSRCPQDVRLLSLAARAALLLAQPAAAVVNATAALAALQLEPQPDDAVDEAMLRCLLVQALEACGEWAAALAARQLLLALTPAPDLDDWHALLACAAQAGQPDVQQQAARQALALDPDDAPAHSYLAQAARTAGDFAAAAAHYRRLLQRDAAQPLVWLALVAAYQAAGQTAKALAALAEAEQALPQRAHFPLALGRWHQAQGDLPQALVCYQRAARLAPLPTADCAAEPQAEFQLGDADVSPLEIALQLGQVLLQLARLDEAHVVLQAAYPLAQAAGAGLDVAWPRTYGQVLLRLGQAGEAIPLLSDAAARCPADAELSLHLAQALLQASPDAAAAGRALPFLQRLLGADAALMGVNADTRPLVSPLVQAQAQSLIAEAYARLGEWSQAMTAYRQALDAAPAQDSSRRARLSSGLGQAALRLDQPQVAVAALQDAAQVEPHNAAVLRSLAEAYLACGLPGEALHSAHSALAAQPDDLGALDWFIAQALRLAQASGPLAAEARLSAQQGLEQAAQMAAGRGDGARQAALLLRQAALHLDGSDSAAAGLSLRRLVAEPALLAALAPGELYRMAVRLTELELPEVEIALLQAALNGTAPALNGAAPALNSDAQALSGVASDAANGSAAPDDMPAPGVLYLALAQAHQRRGDAPAALAAVETALALRPDEPELHVRQADLLQALARPEDALRARQAAVRLAPRRPQLRHRLAQALHATGDLSGALDQAEAGIAHLDPQADPPLSRALHRLAAGLAYATLRPRLAFDHWMAGRGEPGATPSADELAQEVEIALDAGQEAQAETALQALLAQAPDTARSLALAGRWRGRRGDIDGRERGCRAARQALLKEQLEQTPITPPSTREAYIAQFLAVAQVALESRLWDDALATLNRLIEIIPHTPLAHFKLAQVLVLRGEMQQVCRDLDVLRHAPGEAALSAQTHSELQAALSQTQALLFGESSLEVTDDLRAVDDECRTQLGVWQARGRALFQPDPAAARILAGLLQAVPQGGEGRAALVMAYRRANQPDLALQAAQGDPLVAHLPLVLLQAALAQAAGPKPNPEAALALLEPALSAPASDNWPPMPLLHYLTARLARQAGRHEQAAKALGLALAAWPDEARWQALAGQVFLSHAPAQGLPDAMQALLHLEQAAALEPDQAETHYYMGWIYLQGGQAARAAEALERAVTLSPEHGASWLALAQAQLAGGALEAAAASADRATAHSPAPERALLLRGQIALQAGNPRGALSRAQSLLRAQAEPQAQAAEHTPLQVEAYHLLAQALEALDRPAEALKALDRALALAGDQPAMQLERVHLLRRSDGLEAALPALQALTAAPLIAAQPQAAELLALLADWQAEAGQDQAAVQTARQALQPGAAALPEARRARLHSLIGSAMHRGGQLDQALLHLSEAALLAPANLDALLELGHVHQARREYKLALKVFQKAMSVAGGDFRPYYQAGLVLKDSKDYLAAEAMLRRAAQLAPNEVGVHRLLGAVVALNLVHRSRLAS